MLSLGASKFWFDVVKCVSCSVYPQVQDNLAAQAAVKQQMKKLEKEREKVLRESQKDRSDEVRHLQAKQEATKKKLEAAREEMKQFQAVDVAPFDDSEHQERIVECKTQLENANRKRQQFDLSIKQARAAAGNRANLFGPHVTQIDRKISERAGQFSKRPIGPLGQYVAIDKRDMKYAPQVEYHLRNVLNSYVVSCYPDQKLLRGILEEAYRDGAARGGKMPSVIVQSFDTPRYDIPEVKHDGTFPAIADITRIDNDVVFNVIVNQTQIEAWMLAEGSDDPVTKRARVFVTKHERIVKGVLLSDLSQITYKGGATNWTQTHETCKGVCFVPDQSEAIETYQRQEKVAAHEVETHRKKLAEFEADLKRRVEENRAAQNNAKIQLTVRRKTINGFEAELKDVEQQIAEATETRAPETSVLDRNIAAAEAELQELTQEHFTFQEKAEKLRLAAQKINAEVAEEAKQNASRESDANADEQYKAAITAVTRKKEESKKFEASFNKHKAELGKYEADYKKMAQTAEESRPGSDAIPRRDLKELSKMTAKVKSLEFRVQQERKIHRADLNELQADMQQAETELQQHLDAMKKLQSRLDTNLFNREKREKEALEFRNMVGQLTHISFDETLKRRGHRGNARFDHKEKEIDLQTIMGAATGNKSVVCYVLFDEC
jgi:chromosome segregation ATPase